MRRLLLGLAMAAMVAAKPELYREKEDFQYSRSSSDEGTKSGYYDAQRGNMGGNYERAHNMDNLAQHQMGGLMKQVQGELGDGSRTRSGNVFTSANSQGIYGSGRYDLTNLGNRNFQEGTSYGSSQSQSSSSQSAANKAFESHSSSSQNNARYNANSQTQSSGFGGLQTGNLQDAQNIYGTAEHGQRSQSGHSSRFYTQSAYQGGSEYDQSNLNQQASSNVDTNLHNRESQIRILVRPGTRVFVPINAQTTSGSHTGAYYDRNTAAANSDAEVLNTGDQQTVYLSKPKNYESSYSYHKQWEKHDTKPVPLSTIPAYQIPVNSELYDSRLRHGSHFEAENLNQASSQARHQSDFNSQQQITSLNELRNQAEYNQQHSASSASNSNAFTQSSHNSDSDAQSANVIGSLSSKPKSYSSSYSYHKSWERQGDPYVIKPATNGAYDTQASQRLTDLSGSQNQYSFQNYGSRFTKSHQGYTVSDCVTACDPLNSHVRVSRSASNNHYGQDTLQTQNSWSHFNEGQQSQQNFQNLEDLGQQTQNKWDNFEDLGQQTQQNFQNLEDLGQQTQNKWDNLEELGQQTQQNFQNLENLGQQTQNKWDNLEELGQQTQQNFQNLENLGQQTQNKWDNLEELGQQTQQNFQNLENLGQQTQNKWDNLEELGQQTQQNFQNLENLGQHTQNKWDNLEELSQQTQDEGQQKQDFGQETQDFGQELQDFGQEVQNSEQQNVNKWDVGQETQNSWNNLGGFRPQSESLNEQKPANLDKQGIAPAQPQEVEDFGQQTQNKWNIVEEQNTQNQDIHEGMQPQLTNDKTASFWDHIDDQKETQNTNDETSFTHSVDDQSVQHSFQSEDKSKQTEGIWDNLFSPSNNNPTFNDKSNNKDKPLNSLWDKIDNLDTDNIGMTNNQNDKDVQNHYFSQTSPSQSSQHSEDQYSFDIFAGTSDQQENVKDSETLWGTEKEGEKNVDWKTTTENTLVTTTEKLDKHSSKDIGRGDIGPEENLHYLSSSTTEKAYVHFSETSTAGNKQENDQQGTQISSSSSVHQTNANSAQDTVSYLNSVETNGNKINGPNVHSVEIANTPEEVEKQFPAQSTQQLSESFINHNNYHHTSIDTEHQNTLTQERSEWESHQSHPFEHDHVSGHGHHNCDHHEHGFYHHQHGFHQQYGFNHENTDFENKPDRESYEKHDHSYFQNRDLEQEQQNTENFRGQLVGFDQHENHFSHHQHNLEQQFENFNQQFTDFSQQNQQEQSQQWQVNQHFVDFSHQSEQSQVALSQQTQKWVSEQQNQFTADFSQQNQESQFQKHFSNIQQKNVDNLQDFEQHATGSEFDVIPIERKNLASLQTNGKQETNDDKTNDDSQQITKQEAGLSAAKPNEEKANVDTQPEPTTVKPGFWKSVGNKFSSAKSKVASWFGS